MLRSFLILFLFFVTAGCSNFAFGQAQETNLLPIKQNGKCGYIDKTGRVVIRPKFDDCWYFSEGFGCVVFNKKMGFIDSQGKYLLKPEFVPVSRPTNPYLIGGKGKCDSAFSEGVASVGVIVNKKERLGFLDKTGKITFIPRITALGDFSEGMVPFRRDGSIGFLDRNFKVVVEPKFLYAERFLNGLALVTHNRNDLIVEYEFFIDKDGNKVFECRRDSGGFSEGKASFKENGKYGYINTKNEVVIERKFDEAYPFTEGLARVKIREKFGFIDEKGNFAISARFDDAEGFNDGLVAIKLGKKWGLADRTGKIVVPAKFEERLSYRNDGIWEIGITGNTGYIDKKGKLIWLNQQ